MMSVLRSDKVLLILTERLACSLTKSVSGLWLSNGRMIILGLMSESLVDELVSFLKIIEK